MCMYMDAFRNFPRIQKIPTDSENSHGFRKFRQRVLTTFFKTSTYFTEYSAIFPRVGSVLAFLRKPMAIRAGGPDPLPPPPLAPLIGTRKETMFWLIIIKPQCFVNFSSSSPMHAIIICCDNRMKSTKY